jgi:hypothetical protein
VASIEQVSDERGGGEKLPGDAPGAVGQASAYSTAGGGVVLEHAYGGALLAELLLGGPVAGLGNDVTPARIGFQQGARSPVDDLTVTGTGPGGERTLFIGVRRKPAIGASQKPFVTLMTDYLRVISEHGDELEAGSWRLGLAVEAPHTPTDEIKALACFARDQPEAGLFRAAVHAPRATKARVRSRLGNVDDVVAAAVKQAKEAGIAIADGDGGDDLSWRLLKYLHVLDLRLEGDDAAGRTSLVARLVPLAGDAAAADDLRRRLCELSARYAVGSAVVTEEMLRRDLSGIITVAASPAFRASWDVLESLEDSLNSRTRRSLSAGRPGTPAGARQLTVDRADIRAGLTNAMSAAGQAAGQLVVHGDPGTGKSAAVLSAVAEVRQAGGTVIALSLRDLSPGPAAAAAHILQAPPRALLAATAAAPVRLLVLDGAEAAQETSTVLLHDLARAAWQAGLGLVAVTRDDARETVAGALADALGPATGEPRPAAAEMEVPPLTDSEADQVLEAFPVLGRVATDERSAWLLRRVGILDVLLRGGAVASLPGGSLSEADVLGAVWHAWIRNREQPLPGGATPDGRDEAMTGLARRRLAGRGPGGPLTSDSRALASLRSDGLLLPAGPRFALRPGDHFSGDMVRDFALAVLFTRDGFGILSEAGAPRWALRAARIACQGMLVGPGLGGPDLAGRMRDLQRQFDAIAAASGDRWADLPWEATLNAGTAESIIRECADDLLQPGGILLDRILRLVTQRFSHKGAADPDIAAPVVAFLTDHADKVAAVRYRFAGEAAKLTASWLRAVRRTEMAGKPADRWRPLRARVRDRLLHDSSTGEEAETTAECLALLGPDTNAQVTRFLRDLTAAQPHRLAACVERYDPAMSLAETDLGLLLELTEAYYIEQPAATAGLGWHNTGIRRHKHTHPGFGPPFADMRFGPFWLLVPAAPTRALALVNRMLDHAVTCHASPRPPAWLHPAQPAGSASDVSVPPGIQLDIPGIGSRHYAGADHVWAWYRGAGTGPYPCMSALLAVEWTADQWLRQGTPLTTLVTALLRDANNLAMPGLVAGLLERHAEQVAGEADPFLASPDVWELESARALMEAGPRARGRDDPGAPGGGRRGWTMADLAACLVFNAVHRGDQDRVDELRAAGSVLVAAAEAADPAAAGTGGGRFRTAARRWASMLDAASYQAGQDNGNITWEWQPPADTEAAAALHRGDLERRSEIQRLINAYSLCSDPPYLNGPLPVPPPQVVAADARAARGLAGQPPQPGPSPLDAATAVAAALLRAAAQPAGPVARDDLEWAAVTIGAVLSQPLRDPGASGGTVFAARADLSAASAAACLLMPALTEPGDEPALLDDEDLTAVAEILASSAASPFTGVRMMLARTLGPVWSAPCGPGPHGSSRCRHVIAWAAVEAGAREVALGPWELPAGHRGRRQLDGPLPAALAGCPAGSLMLDLLAPPLVAALGGAASGSCVATTARELRDSLLSAYTRTAVLWGEEGYDHRDEDQYAVAEALLAAAGKEPGLPPAAAAGLADQAQALAEALHAMTVAATYSPGARASLRAAWPAVMTAVLDAADVGAAGLADRHWGERAIAAMIPSPSPVNWDPRIDSAISAARDGWPAPSELSGQIARLLPRAAGYWHAADQLVGLLRTVPLAEQARTGLPWVHQVITGRARQPGLGTWLTVGWLRSLSEGNAVHDEMRPLYDAVLDALAAEDYQGAVELQRQGE